MVQRRSRPAEARGRNAGSLAASAGRELASSGWGSADTTEGASATRGSAAFAPSAEATPPATAEPNPARSPPAAPAESASAEVEPGTCLYAPMGLLASPRRCSAGCRGVVNPVGRRGNGVGKDADEQFRWCSVIVPSLTPQIMLGVRIASALALIVTLLMDIFGTGTGLGRLLVVSQQSFDASAVWGLLCIVGLFGYVTSSALTKLGRLLDPPTEPVARHVRGARHA